MRDWGSKMESTHTLYTINQLALYIAIEFLPCLICEEHRHFLQKVESKRFEVPEGRRPKSYLGRLRARA